MPISRHHLAHDEMGVVKSAKICLFCFSLTNVTLSRDWGVFNQKLRKLDKMTGARIVKLFLLTKTFVIGIIGAYNRSGRVNDEVGQQPTFVFLLGG